MMLALLAVTVGLGSAPLPAETLTAFYRAANRAAYEEAQVYWAPEGLPGLKGGLRAFCEHETEGRTLERVEVLKQQVHGDEAEVRVELYFSSGLALHEGTLVRRNGTWKIRTIGS
jgi:hypothetical protein